MGLSGKLIAAIEFKAGGDLFHELVRYKPQHISTASPDKVQGCDLHADGKEKIAIHLIQSIDEEKKLIEFKTLEGDLMEQYKTFVITIHIENKGDIDLVTWTLEYETLKENVEHPISMLSFFIDLSKDIEDHHVGKP